MSSEIEVVPHDYNPTPEASRAELKRIVSSVATGGRLSFEDVNALVSHDSDPDSSRINAVTTLAVPGGMLAGHLALKTTVEHYREDLPTFGTLPELAHEYLSHMAALPFFDQDPPISAALRDHAPNLSLFLSLAYIGLEAARIINRRSFNQKVGSARSAVVEAYRNGTMRWKLDKGASVAFIGHGDPLAHAIAKKRPVEILQISNTPVEGVWTHLPREADYAATQEALDRADLVNAGELLFFPIKPTHEFIPGRSDHDISVDRIVNYIIAADEYLARHGKPKLPVKAVGSKDQTESYIDAENGSHNHHERPMTLEQRLAALAKERGRKIEIIDPTEVIFKRIIEIAATRPITYSSTSGSFSTFADNFFEGLEECYASNTALSPVKVIYNNNDYPTVSEACPDDIPIILDPSQKQALIYRGVPENRILVVRDELLKAIAPLIQNFN